MQIGVGSAKLEVVERKRRGRKLLVASLGVAAVSYVACGSSNKDTVANLVAPPADAAADTQSFDVVANLVAPPTDGQVTGLDVVANLMAPIEDASDGDAADAARDVAVALDVVANLIAPPDDAGD